MSTAKLLLLCLLVSPLVPKEEVFFSVDNRNSRLRRLWTDDDGVSDQDSYVT
jgi:hypothetical protein